VFLLSSAKDVAAILNKTMYFQLPCVASIIWSYYNRSFPLHKTRSESKFPTYCMPIWLKKSGQRILSSLFLKSLIILERFYSVFRRGCMFANSSHTYGPFDGPTTCPLRFFRLSEGFIVTRFVPCRNGLGL